MWKKYVIEFVGIVLLEMLEQKIGLKKRLKNKCKNIFKYRIIYYIIVMILYIGTSVLAQMIKAENVNLVVEAIIFAFNVFLII